MKPLHIIRAHAGPENEIHAREQPKGRFSRFLRRAAVFAEATVLSLTFSSCTFDFTARLGDSGVDQSFDLNQETGTHERPSDANLSDANDTAVDRRDRLPDAIPDTISDFLTDRDSRIPDATRSESSDANEGRDRTPGIDATTDADAAVADAIDRIRDLTEGLTDRSGDADRPVAERDASPDYAPDVDASPDHIPDMRDARDIRDAIDRPRDNRPEAVDATERRRDVLSEERPVSWWDTDWRYCREIIISGSVPLAYQHGLTFTPATFDYADMEPDWRSARFLQGTCSAPDRVTGVLSAWAETINSAGETKIWVKTPAAVATIAMYYGNPAAASVFNGNATFVFFNNFGSAAGWSAQPGGIPCAITGGYAHCGRGAGWRYSGYTTQSNDWRGLALEAQVSGPGQGAVIMSQNIGTDWWGVGDGLGVFGSEGAFLLNTIENGLRAYDSISERITALHVRGSAAISDAYARGWDGIGGLLAVRINIPSGSEVLSPFIGDGGLDFSDFYWIRIRKYVQPTPTYLIGSRQVLP